MHSLLTNLFNFISLCVVFLQKIYLTERVHQIQSPPQSYLSLPLPYNSADFSGVFKNLEKWERIENARVQLPENIATIKNYFIFDPETFNLSLEMDYFWEVCRVVW